MSNVSVQYETAYVAEVRIKTEYDVVCTPSFPLGKGPNGEEKKVLSQILRMEELAKKHNGEMLKLSARDDDRKIIIHLLFRQKEDVEAFKKEATA